MKFGFSFGYQASGSIALANILYNMDTFNVDVSSLRTIDNAGSDGATADASMYGSNHIYLGATQSVDYVTVNTGDYAYFDVTIKAHVKATATGATTTISTPTHHSNFFSLKAGKSISAGDITELNANPEDIARMVKGVATIGTYSFTLADIEAFYPGNEGSASGAYIQDITTALGADVVSNGTFDTNITGWGGFATTVVWDASNGGCIKAGNGAGGVALPKQTGILSNTKKYKLSFDYSTTDGTKPLSVYSGGYITIVPTTDIVTTGAWTSVSAIFDNVAGNTELVFGQQSVATYAYFDNVIVEEVTAVPITNYAASCRTTYLNTNYGASNFLYTQDASGRLTGMHTSGHIKSGTDGRNITIAMTSPYNHVVTKDIDKIEGNLTSCTITYSDTTTLVVP